MVVLFIQSGGIAKIALTPAQETNPIPTSINPNATPSDLTRWEPQNFYIGSLNN
jgi:hypothetical protein